MAVVVWHSGLWLFGTQGCGCQAWNFQSDSARITALGLQKVDPPGNTAADSAAEHPAGAKSYVNGVCW